MPLITFVLTEWFSIKWKIIYYYYYWDYYYYCFYSHFLFFSKKMNELEDSQLEGTCICFLCFCWWCRWRRLLLPDKKVQKIQSMLYFRLQIIILPYNKSINRSHRQFQRVPGKMLSMRFACRILEFVFEHFFGFAEVTGSNLISRLIDWLINF